MDNTEKALQILKTAEIKESDFKSESIYNTIIGNIIKLLEEQDLMKEALFHRNTMIQDLDQEVQELTDKVESLEHDVHLTEAQFRSSKIDVEVLKDALTSLKIKYNECVRNSVM